MKVILRARSAVVKGDDRSAQSTGGFTLIELMIVVLIIAILIAIAVPTFLGLRERGYDS